MTKPAAGSEDPLLELATKLVTPRWGVDRSPEANPKRSEGAAGCRRLYLRAEAPWARPVVRVGSPPSASGSIYSAPMAEHEDRVEQLLVAAEKVLRHPAARVYPHRKGCGGFGGLGDECWCGMTDLQRAVSRFRSGDEETPGEESAAARRKAERRVRWWGQG